MEDAPRLLKIPKSECPDFWKRLPRHKWPKSWTNIEDPVVPLERRVYGHPLAGDFMEETVRGSSVGIGWEKGTKLGVSICSPKTLSVCVDDTKMAGKTEYGFHVEEINEKMWILKNQHHFLTT